MKRSWFGLALLLGLLILCLYTSRTMVRVHQETERELNRAAALAAHGDWEQAQAAFRKGRQLWQRRRSFRAALADHTPVEEIDAAFAAAEIYCTARDPVTFRAACTQLARQISAVGQAHALSWENLL